MSWRDTIQPIDSAPTQASSWRDTIKPIEEVPKYSFLDDMKSAASGLVSGIPNIPSKGLSMAPKAPEPDYSFVDDMSMGAAIAGNSIIDNTPALGRGGIQSFLMNGADELGGLGMKTLDLGQAGLNKIGLTGPSPSQVNQQLLDQGFTGDLRTDMYRQGQEETEAEFKAAEQESPWLYGLGQLGGAVASGMMTAPLLAGAGTAIGASKAGSAATQALGQALPGAAKYFSSGKTLPNALTAAGKMAAIAAPEGAVFGALGSENNLIGASPEERANFRGDIIEGTATGSLIGAGMGLAGELVPAAGRGLMNYFDDTVEDSNVLRQAKVAYKEGQEGINYGSTKQGEEGLEGVFDATASRENNAAADFSNRILKADEELGKAVGRSLDLATDAGVKVKINSQIKQLAKDIDASINQNPLIFGNGKAVKTFKNLDINAMSPRDMKSAINDIDEALTILKRDNRADVGFMVRDMIKLQKALSEELKTQIPQYAKAAKRFASMREAIPETITAGGSPSKFRPNSNMLGNMKEADSKLFGSMYKLVGEATREGAHEGSETFAALIKNSKLLEKEELARILRNEITPDQTVFKMMGFDDAASFIKAVKKEADKSAAIRGAQKTALMAEGTDTVLQGLSKGGLANVGQGAVPKTANAFGRYSTGMKKVGKSLYSMGPQQLNEVAEKLISKQSSSQIGQALQDAITNSDQAKKNAILFTIMQNPNLRLDLVDQVPSEDQEAQ